MSRIITIFVLIFLGVVLIGYATTQVKFTGNQILKNKKINGNYSVEIENYRYSPNQLTLNLGETVQWINLDSSKHTVTSYGDGPLNSVILRQGETYSYTFNSLGEFPYYCTLHPYMEGKIIVK